MTASGPGSHSLTTGVHDRRPRVEGTVPDWLSGTLVRNGPARFEAGGRRVTSGRTDSLRNRETHADGGGASDQGHTDARPTTYQYAF